MAGHERRRRSLAEGLAAGSLSLEHGVIDRMKAGQLVDLRHNWPFWQRPDQMPPPGNWRIWLVMAGRGFGKTRMGAEWVRAQAESNRRLKVALVGATQADARRVMIEGESGLLAIAPPRWRPRWEPSLGRLTWPNGAQAHVYSAAEPDSLRGPEHGIAWADEIGKWAEGEAAWSNLELTMRAGRKPRIMATTTPRPVPLIRRLLAQRDVAVTHGRSAANRAHLAEGFLDAVTAIYGGTRLGRQELDGELVDDVAGALWTRDLIERCRAGAAPGLDRVVIGVDPPAGTAGDACGIVAVGLAPAAGPGAETTGYVLEDASVAGLSPEGWARAVAACATRHGADRVVAESNNGGAMVRSVLHAADAGLPVSLVHATRGKAARAEPVATLYERGRVCHVGAFQALEDQMCGLVAGGRL